MRQIKWWETYEWQDISIGQRTWTHNLGDFCKGQEPRSHPHKHNKPRLNGNTIKTGKYTTLTTTNMQHAWSYTSQLIHKWM